MPKAFTRRRGLAGRLRQGRATGFTLIELLVVIAIIALLVSILSPSLQKAKDLAVKMKCLSMERAIMLGLIQYLEDFDGNFPDEAPFWADSLSKPGPAWTQKEKYDHLREGIGDYLSGYGGDYWCEAAGDYENTYSWGLSRGTFPTYTPNRRIIPYWHVDKYDDPNEYWAHARHLDRITEPYDNWVFADGNWRGTFQAFSLYYEENYKRFFWGVHDGGVNVGYMDGHADWVSDDKNVHPDDWPAHNKPDLDWCAMTDWKRMWK